MFLILLFYCWSTKYLKYLYLTFITSSIFPGEDASSVDVILEEVSLVLASVGPHVSALAVLHAVLIFAFV
jgi:hypothetical protein